MWNEILAGASVLLAVGAIWQTRRQRIQAIRDAAAANAAAIRQLAADRETTFQLEVLRDLVVRLDATNTQPDGLMQVLKLARAIPGLWQLIPAAELPFWQMMYDAMENENSPDWGKVDPELIARGIDPAAARRWATYSGLRQDLLDAINSRVNRDAN